MLKELKRYLRERIDFDNVQPEEINRQVEVLLRQALDSNFEALSNKKHRDTCTFLSPTMWTISPAKLVSRENTDYDTFRQHRLADFRAQGRIQEVHQAGAGGH